MVSKDLFLRLSKKYRDKHDKGGAIYSLLSTHPPIIYTSRHSASPLESLDPIFEYLQDRVAYFLTGLNWDMENPKEVKTLSLFEKQHINKYHKHQFIHLCNTLEELIIFQEHGLNAIFCNQNCLIDEAVFKPIASIPKQFDAIYDAQIGDYKRHYLANKVDNIAFIYYYNPIKDRACYEEVIRQFPNAYFFNSSPSGDYRNLSPSEVNQCLNSCRVGLCLSSVEGAMYASIQYLLSGLPIVSTQSKGGRDIFFDEEYTLIVEDDPDAVKEGVAELIRRNIAAESIRHKVLMKVQQHRLRFISVVQSIYDQEGVDRNFLEEWNTIFSNKLFKYQRPEEAIKQLELAKVQT